MNSNEKDTGNAGNARRSLKEILEHKKALALLYSQEQAQKCEEAQEKLEEQKQATALQAAIKAAEASTPVNPTTPKRTLKQLLEAKLQQKHGIPDVPDAPVKEAEKTETFSLSVVLNEKQILAKEMAFAGKSFCLVGAAGTGKTTAQREIAAELLRSGRLSRHEFRIQGTGERVEAPSIGFVAYTKIASGNLKRAIHKDPDLELELMHNVTTIHNLLEYSPETYWDEATQTEKFRFSPKRHRGNKLDITHLVIEESSMVGLDLGQKLMDALHCGVQIIYIGDINQLPPVFGDSVLNYALMQLPVIELTQVYRQKGDSTILENAHRILKGESLIEAPDFKIVRGGDVQHTQAKLAVALGAQFPAWKAKGVYNPETDIILSPWNKKDLGTDNLNKWIAQSLGTERKATVHEVIAGISKLYLAVGDKVMVDKRVGYIEKIAFNGRYIGRAPLPASTSLTRFGSYTGVADESEQEPDYANLDIDKLMDAPEEELKREASHVVDVILEDGESVTLEAVGDFAPNNFSLAYALTVHKAQGCEWDTVFIVLHRDHAVSLYRELLYTAITRARKKVVLIAKDAVIERAIKTQRIKGDTVEEKIMFFNSGVKLTSDFKCMK